MSKWAVRADERLRTLSTCNQELLVIKDKVGKLQVSLEWASLWYVIIFPSSALTLLSGIWWWQFDWSFAHLVSSTCHHHLHYLSIP